MRHDSGFYQLLIFLCNAKSISVGKLGTFSFLSGYYIYTGSAKGGLSARIARHIGKRKKMHWHIDYLLKHGKILSVKRFENGTLSECQLNQRTKNLTGSKIVAKGFGSSDCKCKTHLIFFQSNNKQIKAAAEKPLKE